MLNFLIKMGYQGTYFQGVVPHPHALTVGEEIKSALQKKGWGRLSLHFVSRTDAGVHAQMNLAQLCVKGEVGEQDVDVLNYDLPPHLRIQSLFECPNFQAISPLNIKTYHYAFSNDESLVASTQGEKVLYWRERLDFLKMEEVAKSFEGENDFFFFQRRESPKARENAKRFIVDSKLAKYGENTFVYSVTSQGFMRNMVRYMVGAMINVGQGKVSLEQVVGSLKRTHDFVPGFCVPPEGLSLHEIRIH